MKKTILLIAIVLFATAETKAPAGDPQTLHDVAMFSYMRGYHDAQRTIILFFLKGKSGDLDSMIDADSANFNDLLDSGIKEAYRQTLQRDD